MRRMDHELGDLGVRRLTHRWSGGRQVVDPTETFVNPTAALGRGRAADAHRR